MLPADPDRGGITEHAAPRVAPGNLRGTGCTLSAAIAALLPSLPLVKVVEEAGLYLTEALKASGRLTVGRGRGPVHHFHALWREELPAGGG
ncbi:bifunctional hydroxymethylpyrimidine kinase/phosphomethylpyrimidine kinase [Labrys sp. La1]|uniref:bifunctional hydroxymethylpyrimidine kinase/phosphomethylpyrimidine kinase n=1 Tax=Labrys sp. La1 TaxID=3404917 RepID=UPI003EB8B87A